MSFSLFISDEGRGWLRISLKSQISKISPIVCKILKLIIYLRSKGGAHPTGKQAGLCGHARVSWWTLPCCPCTWQPACHRVTAALLCGCHGSEWRSVLGVRVRRKDYWRVAAHFWGRVCGDMVGWQSLGVREGPNRASPGSSPSHNKTRRITLYTHGVNIHLLSSFRCRKHGLSRHDI